MKTLPSDVAHFSDIGPHRPRNEDVAFADPEHSILMVADGLGGAAAGDRAARITTDIVAAVLGADFTTAMIPSLIPAGESRAVIERMAPPDEALTDPSERLRFAFLLAHTSVLAEGRRSGSVGMSTALVVAWLSDAMCRIAHVGDCRAYTLEDGKLTLHTLDHSLSSALDNRKRLPEKIKESPFLRSRLTQVVGGEHVPSPDIEEWAPSQGTRLLLCSDGVWGSLSQPELLASLGADAPAPDLCRVLVQRAISAGSRDNATALVALF